MTDAAIIQGSLVDVRNVNQHKCVRMLIDVPAELAPKVMEAFGWPTMANPVPVAIARLQEPSAKAEKPKRNWNELSKREQAVLKCNDPEFIAFMGTMYAKHVIEEHGVAWCVRNYCGVQSRTDLDKNEEASRAWDRLYSNFQFRQRGAAA